MLSPLDSVSNFPCFVRFSFSAKAIKGARGKESGFRRLAKRSVFQRVSDALSDDPDFDTFLRTARLSGRTGRRPAQGGTSKQGIGRSGGGLTSKTVAVTDAPGYLVRFVPLPGQARDFSGMPDLLGGLEFGALIGDGALDADWPTGEVERRGDGMRHGGDAIEAESFGAAGPRRGDVQMASLVLGSKHGIPFFPKA